ncbi:hypothetical protein MMC07_004055 [Pseudocyphellaria aurata]|nr:hypothetical protein [Pseudocyphellaria aurata]
MGQAVSAVREVAKQQGDQAERTANDALNSLQDLAKTQVKLFTGEVKNNTDTTKVAIEKIVAQEVIIKCGVETAGDKIANDIMESYHAFADSDTAKGIGSVLSTGLDALFGNSSAQSNEVSKYFVTVGKMGYPYRVDMHLYAYQFTSETLIKVTKNVLAVSIVISSVKLTDLDDRTIGAMVQLCYGEAAAAIQQKILDKLLAIKAQCARGIQKSNNPTVRVEG